MIEEVGINVAQNHVGETVEKMVAHVNKPLYVCKNDSFVAVFPALETRITCGIDFPQVQSNGILRIQKNTNLFFCLCNVHRPLLTPSVVYDHDLYRCLL